MSFVYRYKYLEILTRNNQICVHLKKYVPPHFLSSKDSIYLTEKDIWDLDRAYFKYISKELDDGMWMLSFKCMSLKKTFDNLHRAFLDIQHYKRSNNIPLDVEVTFIGSWKP